MCCCSAVTAPAGVPSCLSLLVKPPGHFYSSHSADVHCRSSTPHSLAHFHYSIPPAGMSHSEVRVKGSPLPAYRLPVFLLACIAPPAHRLHRHLSGPYACLFVCLPAPWFAYIPALSHHLPDLTYTNLCRLALPSAGQRRLGFPCESACSQGFFGAFPCKFSPQVLESSYILVMLLC